MTHHRTNHRYHIPPGTRFKPSCKHKECRQSIAFITSPDTGRKVPINTDGTSHFTTCPGANQFSSTRKASWERPNHPQPLFPEAEE